MEKSNNAMRIPLLVAAVFFLTASAPCWADDFDGLFTGVYGTGWSTLNGDNPTVLNHSSAVFDANGLTLSGATSASVTPFDPASQIDFTHLVVGSGPTTISFSSLFFDENTAHPGDGAAFIENGTVVQDLSEVGVQQTFTFTMTPGDTFGFRLFSDNDNIADTLQITQTVPEPTSASLALVGGLLFSYAVIRRQRR